MLLVKERDKIRQGVVKLEDDDNLENEIEKLEKDFFRKQIEIYDLDLKILEDEEKFIRLHLKEFVKEADEEDDDTFYEAFEEQPEDKEWSENVSGKEDNGKDPEELKRKQEWIRRLNRIFRKRAWLRNKKV